jgi:hypothetical protein
MTPYERATRWILSQAILFRSLGIVWSPQRIDALIADVLPKFQ